MLFLFLMINNLKSNLYRNLNLLEVYSSCQNKAHVRVLFILLGYSKTWRGAYLSCFSDLYSNDDIVTTEVSFILSISNVFQIFMHLIKLSVNTISIQDQQVNN